MEPEMREPVPGPKFGTVHDHFLEDALKLEPMLASEVRIFNGMPKAESVTQQLINNCPLPALLAAIAHANPSHLFRMIHYTRLGKPRSVWFHGRPILPSGEMLESQLIITVKFQHRAIEITPRLYVNELRQPRFGFANDGVWPHGGAGWVSYIEKAYVVYRANFRYDELSFSEDRVDAITVSRVVEDVATDYDKLQIEGGTGTFFPDLEPVSFDPTPGHREQFVSVVRRRGHPDRIVDFRGRHAMREMKDKARAMLGRATKRPTIATTFNHTRAVLKFVHATDEVTLFDPLPNHIPRTPSMSLDDFMGEHDAIYQVR